MSRDVEGDSKDNIPVDMHNVSRGDEREEKSKNAKVDSDDDDNEEESDDDDDDDSRKQEMSQASLGKDEESSSVKLDIDAVIKAESTFESG